ncbi:MAG TPA: ABC transporter permease [Chloroflexota bacterium]|nr:ABC transporter permease [Chloroflexota bacterium]
MRLLGFIVKRLFSMVIILLAVSAISFLLLINAPGDPIRANLAQHASADTIKQLDHQYGLDLPGYQRYLNYLGGLLHGNLGLSLTQPGTSVNDLLANGLPVSLKLGGLALLLSLLVGVPLGVIAAVRQNKLLADNLNMGIMLILYSVPAFVLIPFVVDIFSINLHWLPAGQWGDPGWQGVKEAVLPVIVYAAGLAGFFARSVRSFMLEVLHQDYIRLARAKGLRDSKVIYVHAMKNTLLPFASVLGPTIAFLVVGAFIVENEFSINGIGYITVQSTLAGDYAVTEATTILLAAAVVVVNALTDIFYTLADPRVKL